MLVAPRTRRARAAALAVALAAPAVLGTATPAFASGESTSATLTSPTSGSATTFTWSYAFHQNGGHGLSNIAIGFCSANILADVVSASPSAGVFAGNVPGGHTGFGSGVKFDVTATAGTLTVTFAHPHTISADGLRIQSHSGDGQTGDTITHASGPGGCPSDPANTGGSGNTNTGGSGNTNTGGSGNTNTGGSGNTSNSGGTADPDGTPNPEPTLVIHSDPAPSISTPDPAPATTPSNNDTVVLGETIQRPVVTNTGSNGDSPAVDPAVESATLANTGAGHTDDLVLFGLGFLGAGVLALAAGRRRHRTSVSSAG